ncbi:MAG TPA: hypothetical protein VGG51_13680 [Candidatus Cybelea sp.]
MLTTDQNNYSYYYSYYDIEFYYLPNKSKSLLSIMLPNPYSRSDGWPAVQCIAYDGKYWVVDSYGNLYRYKINIKAVLVDTLHLSGEYGRPTGIALYRLGKAQATHIVAGGESDSGKSFVAYWRYPSLGAPVHQLTADLDDPVGEAVSLRTR